MSRSCRSKHRLHRCHTALILISIPWFLALMIFSNFADWRSTRWQPLDSYTGELPFSSMEKLVSGEFQPKEALVISSVGSQDPTVLHEYSNHIAERTTLLIPRQYALQQHGTVRAEGIPPLKGSLEVTYYEMLTENMAHQLYRELKSEILRDPDFRILTMPDLPTEQEIAYRHAADILLLQDGCHVLKAVFDQQDGGTVLALEQWATAMTEVFMHSDFAQ